MSKINAVRFINLNYNHNTIRVSDETMNFNGESTLVKLDNGGGKSVLVQMITAPFVQKRYRNTKDRPFASYFTSNKPTFILVEWELEQGAGFVMTGMMVRRNQKIEDGNDEELEIINIISEYKTQCLRDLHHLPVVEKTKNETKLKNFAECRAMFDGYKRDKNVRFFTYDMNNSAQARQYFDKLLEYGINYREWQSIIKKINEEESGLSKLFSDCKDERGLVEKWFLETIENKLNREQNRMQEFRSILEKYIAGYRNNQSKIKRRDTILRFEEEAEKIREQASEFRDGSLLCDAKRNEIASYYLVLRGLQATAEKELDVEKEMIEELKKEIIRTDHQSHSANYYKVQNRLRELQEEIDSVNVLLSELEEQLSWHERTLHLLETAHQQEQVDAEREDYQNVVQKLDICRRKGENLKPERDYIGYLLRLHFEEDLEGIVSSLQQAEQAVSEQTGKKTKANEEILKTDEDIRTAAQKKGELASSVQAYDREEERYCSHWGTDLNRNLMGEYESGYLAVLKETLDKELEEENRDRSIKRKQIEDTESNVRRLESVLKELDNARVSLGEKLEQAGQKLSIYEEELRFRKTVLQYLELKENVLFDREQILRTADSKIADIEAIIERGTIEIRELEDEISGLTTGHTVELTPEIEHVLESLDIHVVYGMEWLKRNGNTEEENLALVEKNPFLPYALLMTEKEFEALRNAEASVYTKVPIPVVTRESLAGCCESIPEGMIDNSGVHFYMMFNRNLLNEERLEALVLQKKGDLKRRKEDVDRKRKEHREYLERRSKIAGQAVSKSAYEETAANIAAFEAQLDKNRQEYAVTGEQLSAEKETGKHLQEEMAALVRRLDEKLRQKKELEELIEAYESYLEKRKALFECEERLSALDSHKKSLHIGLQKIEEEIRLWEGRKSEFRLKEADTRKQLAEYELYRETVRPSGLPADLLEDYSALTARYQAITVSISREEKELEGDRKKALDRLAKAEKELNRRANKYDFSPEDWRDIHYSSAEEDHAETEIRVLNERIKEASSRKHAFDKQVGIEEEKSRQTLMWMQRDCGTEAPVPREEIPSIDFVKQKNVLVYQKSEHQKEEERLEKQIQIYGSNLDALSEYQDQSADVPASFDVDFAQFGAEDFRRFTGNLKREYHGAEKRASELRDVLEKTLQQTIRLTEFQDDYYRRPLETILALSSNGGQVLRQLDVVLQSYNDLMAKLMVDIAVVEQERAHVIAALKEYASDIHDQMAGIDRNSSITVRGKSLKMLKIVLPSWEENDNIYQRRIEDMVDELTLKGIALLEKGEPVHEFLGKRLTTRELYNAVVGIGNVRIQLYKIEAQRELQISWSEVARNSGGEGFLSAFIILSSLLYYMRRDDTDIFAERNEGKVLLMDNPFAQTNASHLLKPMMEVAKKNNTQLICLTGLGGESIYNRFDNIYVLNLVESAMNRAQYLRGKHLSGKEPEVISMARIEVSSEEGQLSLVF